jgi:vitamin B12 transporter
VDFGRFRLNGGYSFADARVRASAAARPLDGLRPAQTPRHSLTASLAWAGPGRAYASLGARYASRQFEDDLNAQPIPDALTFDAAAAIPLARGFALDARAENFTGERVVAGISGAGIVERATPRTLWLGLSWRG